MTSRSSSGARLTVPVVLAMGWFLWRCPTKPDPEDGRAGDEAPEPDGRQSAIPGSEKRHEPGAFTRSGYGGA